MNVSKLMRIGLTRDQAEAYKVLLESGQVTPPEFSKLLGESRTTTYMTLAKLEELGLAEREDSTKRLTYTATSPSRLQQILDDRQQKLETAKKTYDSLLPELLTVYHENRQKPGVRFYEGKDSLQKVYQEHLQDNEDVFFVRTPADEEFFGEELYDYMRQRAEKGITAHGLAPATPGTLAYAKANDKKLKRVMSWFNPKQYTAPVEISIYGSKVAFISFGKETIATVIDSPQIAQAMRELFAMAKNSLKS